MERRAVAFLDAHLWSLRSEAEAQLRQMTAIHRRLAALPPITAFNRDAELAKLVASLAELLDANITMRDLCTSALTEAETLPRGVVVQA